MTEKFSFENKIRLDSNNPKVIEWEKLMWKFQQKLPFSKEGEKWVEMEQIFELPIVPISTPTSRV